MYRNCIDNNVHCVIQKIKNDSTKLRYERLSSHNCLEIEKYKCVFISLPFVSYSAISYSCKTYTKVDFVHVPWNISKRFYAAIV